MKRTRFAFLAFLLMALVTVFAGEAAAKPKWLTTKVKAASEFINSQKTYKLEGEWLFEVKISNDSDDRIVTQISEMKGVATYTVVWSTNRSSSKPNTKKTIRVPFGSNDAFKVELTPGESKSYKFRASAQVHNTWGYFPQGKFDKVEFDCSVKSKEEGGRRKRR